MTINDLVGYEWRRAIGAVSSGIALVASLYLAQPTVYAQGGQNVNVTTKGGKVAVSPRPYASPSVQPTPVPSPAPAAPATANAPSTGKALAPTPAPQVPPQIVYGASPICGTDVKAYIGDKSAPPQGGADLVSEIKLKDYACLTPEQAQGRGIDPKSSLAWKSYTQKPSEACPGQTSCYKLPARVEPQPDLLAKLGGIDRTLEEMGKAEIARQQKEEERRTAEADRLRQEREEQRRQLDGFTRQLRTREDQERLRAAEPLIPFSGAYGLAEVLSGDARGLLAAYGAGAAFHVATNVDLEVAGGMLHQYGTLEQRTSPDPSTERRLLPDGTTYKLTEDSTTTLMTDKPTGFFGRVRGAYQTPLNWLKAFVGTDVRGREEGATVTDYAKTISLERNDRPLRDPKTIRDTVEQDADWNAGLYLHGGAQACRSFGPVTGCLEAQGGYDFHTESPQYGGGVRLGFE